MNTNLPPFELFSNLNNRGKKVTAYLGILIFSLFFVNATLVADNCTVNAGLDQTICASASLTLSGTVNGLIPGATTWTQVSGPAVIIDNPNSLVTTVTGYSGSGAGTVYKFWLSTTCEDGALVSDECIVTVKPITISNAGPPQTLCPGTGGTLAANVAGLNETGAWTTIGTNNGVTVTNLTSPTSTLTLDPTKTGNTTLRWTITNSDGCVSTSDVLITNLGGVSPVDAGPDITITTCYSNTVSATMAAGIAGISPQGGVWTCVSGPNIPTISVANSTKWNASITNLIEGTYTMRWTVSGPCVNGYDEMQIFVPPASQGLTGIKAASTQIYCDSRTQVVLTNNAPTLAGETGTWTKVSGAGSQVITNPTSATTTVTGLIPNPEQVMYLNTRCRILTDVIIQPIPPLPSLPRYPHSMLPTQFLFAVLIQLQYHSPTQEAIGRDTGCLVDLPERPTLSQPLIQL